MRIAIQIVLFLLLSHFRQASSMAPALRLDTTASEKNADGHSKLYSKGDGTASLIAGLTPGPVGLLGAHLFSHNPAVRKKAVAAGAEADPWEWPNAKEGGQKKLF